MKKLIFIFSTSLFCIAKFTLSGPNLEVYWIVSTLFEGDSLINEEIKDLKR